MKSQKIIVSGIRLDNLGFAVVQDLLRATSSVIILEDLNL